MSETLNSWNYRQNRISFNFACPFLSVRGSWSNSRWLSDTNLLTGITREKVTVHKRKKFGTFTTDRLIQVRLLIPNQLMSPCKELYSPVHLFTQSRVSMGLTVSRISVKNQLLGVNIDKSEPLVLEKINLRNISFLQCVILCQSRLTAAKTWPQF